MKKVDKVGGALLAFTIGALVVLVLYGPAEHKTLFATGVVGAVGAVTAAFRGRLVKRDPKLFEEITKEVEMKK